MTFSHTIAAKLAALSFMVSVGAPGLAAAQSFDLDFSGPGSVDLTDEFADQGVIFSAQTAPIRWTGDLVGGGSFSEIVHMPLGPDPRSTDPFRVDFVDPVSGAPAFATRFSLRAFDGGGDLDHLFLTGYDADDNVVASAQHTQGNFFGTETLGGVMLGLVGIPIHYVIIDVENTTSGLFFDDFSYHVVPEPDVAILIGLGLVLLGRRRPMLGLFVQSRRRSAAGVNPPSFCNEE